MDGFSILILDPLSGRGRNTGFLLRLANFSMSLVNNDHEAFNWIVNRVDSAELPALLLVNDYQAEMPILRLLPEMRRRGVLLPVLLVERTDGADSPSAMAAQDGVYYCRLENMLSKVRSLTER